MSKRRNRKQSPNLPQEMIERARQQLTQDSETDGAEAEAQEEAAPVEVKAEVKAAPAPAPKAATAKPTAPKAAAARPRSNRRPGLQPAQSRGERKSDSTDTQYIRNRLANPTRFVTEAELRAEYGYVVKDLQTMGVLAGVLLVILVLIEKLL